MNKDAKTINERWFSGMNALCTRIQTERMVFDDAVYSKYHETGTTSFCKGVSFGLYLAISMVESYSNSVYENHFDTLELKSDSAFGGEEDEE